MVTDNQQGAPNTASATPSVGSGAGVAQPPDTSNDEGIGSKAAGYAPPDQGPFSCGNCVHFDGQGSCDNPKVITDPEVSGQVEAEGCCNFFRPSKGEESTGTEQPNYGDDVASLAGGARFPSARRV